MTMGKKQRLWLFSQTKTISDARHEKMKKEKVKFSSLESSTRRNFFMRDLTFCTKESKFLVARSVVQVKCMIIKITQPCQILHRTIRLHYLSFGF